MALMLHGFVSRGVPLPAEAPDHRQVDCGPVTALVSDAKRRADDGIAPAELDGALHHHRLLSTYALGDDVLPIRFGTVFSSEETLAAAADQIVHRIQSGLGQISGCVEYGVAISVSGPVQVGTDHMPPTSGREFLVAKKAARQRRSHLAKGRGDLTRTVVGSAESVARSLQTFATPRPDFLLDCAALVARVNEERFVDEIGASGDVAADLGLTIHLRGPGPCYSFIPTDVSPPENALEEVSAGSHG